MIPFFQKKKLILAEEMIRQNNIIIELLTEINNKLPPYKCKICNQGFLTDSSLRLHKH